MYEYEQTRSFNLGVAQEVSVEAALIYDDLAYAQQVVGRGKWFHRSYEHMLRRFPMYSERTLRRHIKKLEETGWILTKIQKVDGIPLWHCQIGRFLSAKLTETMESAKLTETIYKDNNNYIQLKSGKSNTRAYQESQLLALVNEITNRGFRTLPERGVKKTLDAFTMDEIEQALTALVKDPWHKEKLKEFKIDYLIRATTIDKFLDRTKPAVDQDRLEKQRQWDIEEQEDADAFRNDRREEYFAAKENGTIDEYRKKYGLTFHVY